MAGKIFINYRRGDDPGSAQALFARLEQAFQPEQLFFDVDNIEPGLDFVRVLEEQVAACDVLISVIGRNWIDARDQSGARRLDNPDDFVRIEIESALAWDKRVIPVLVGQASMPSADQLPGPMKPLARRHAVRLTHERFRADTQALITALQRALQSADDARTARTHAPAEAQWQTKDETRRQPDEAGTNKRRVTDADAESRAAKEREHGPPGGAIAVEFGAPAASETRFFMPGAGKTEWFKDLAAGPEMVVVPAGSFTMGSSESEDGHDEGEGPQHNVTIARPFAVSRFAVTFEEWDACVANGGHSGYRPFDEGWGRGRRPVINVSWNDAKGYVDWLAKKTGRPYRLLSEAEWEYIARAGSNMRFWWGNSISTGQANYHGHRQGTLAVDSFEPNPWGLWQVHGNVLEWTEDCYCSDYDGAPVDASPRTTCEYPDLRVIRGGSWITHPDGLRSATRWTQAADCRDPTIGFRVARTLLSP
jgi:formylglycine-generating enzyme required for sulfatase activity